MQTTVEEIKRALLLDKTIIAPGANLACANLACANLRNADLRSANLDCADLSDTDLHCADLRNANLRGANLHCADLRNADLRNADLRSANLDCADLSDTDLRNADLRNANLRSANLRSADLSGADLSGADLSGADLSGVVGIAPITNHAVNLLHQVADIVLADPHRLNMSLVHDTCKTAHCAAGWICTIDPTAATLEKILGWSAAACLVCPIPQFTRLFYSSDEEMLRFLERVKAEEITFELTKLSEALDETPSITPPTRGWGLEQPGSS